MSGGVFEKFLDQRQSEAFVVALTRDDYHYLNGAARKLRVLHQLIPDEGTDRMVAVLERLCYMASGGASVGGPK